MQSVDKQTPQLAALARQLLDLGSDLLSGLPADGEILHLDSTSDLLASQPPTRLFRLQAGQLYCRQREKLVCVLDSDDLVGLCRSLQLPEGQWQSDGPLELLPYELDSLLRHVHASEALQKRWTRYLLCISAFFREALALELPSQFQPAKGFLQFEAGDVIIREGDEADCVYTLLEGSADALSQGVKVGKIGGEEIFGAMAAFTGQPRSATVVATSSCSVLAVRKDQFLDLVKRQPEVCLALVEEMAGKINELNRHILELQ